MPRRDAVLQWLTGTWLLARSIDDGSSMAGTATFAACASGRLDYREQGRFRLPDGRTLHSERRYLFEETDDGFAVLFAETPPRLFHRITLERAGPSLAGAARHLCADDRYDSRYEFRLDGSFTIEHRVRGPRKHYTIRTRYRRNPLIACD